MTINQNLPVDYGRSLAGANGGGARSALANPVAHEILSGESAPIKMKAETNAANGGIGVSYSNVVLAGGFVGRSNSVAQIGNNG